MKKLGEDLKKLREDASKWKEESKKEISQQIEVWQHPGLRAQHSALQPCRGTPDFVPILLVRALRQDTKCELQKMGEQQEMRYSTLEQLVTETANQVNEQVRCWRSTPTIAGLMHKPCRGSWTYSLTVWCHLALLIPFIPPLSQFLLPVLQFGSTGEATSGLGEELQEGNGECSSCTFNIRAYLGKLLQRYEKLQEKVESLESWQMPRGKLKKTMRNWGQVGCGQHGGLRTSPAGYAEVSGRPKLSKLAWTSGLPFVQCHVLPSLKLEHDHERLHYMEATLVQMRGDWEKLSFVSGTLQKDAEQKQKAIEMLFQSLEKVQREKTDEQDVMAAMDM
ncbi:hypothetical protein RLOC_00013434, partial [Lonchura striata]